ncbi:MAG: LTA synthase family protein [Cellulosilyticaceae bacterium]
MKKIIENPYVEKIAQVIIVANITFLLVFISEFIVRGDANDVVRWIFYSNSAFMLTYGLVLCVLLIGTFLLNNIASGYLLTSVLISVASIINFYKLDIKGEQLSVQDFALAGELATMAGDLEIKISLHIVWSVIFIILIYLMLREINFIKLKNRKRLISLLACIVLIVGVNENIYAKGHSVKSGFLLTLVNSAHASTIEMPEHYTKEHVKQITKDIKVESGPHAVKPNIIIVMDESFFNINTMKNLKLSDNPLKHFEAYQKQFSSGNIIGPKIGGYTAQTEYEVLTGNSTDFTGVNNVAYIRYIKPDVDSIVKIFKNEGYYATAIHPYDRKFYSRDEVYEDMGFDNFITQESFENSETINDYIMDKEAFKKVIQEYKQHDDTPFFAHIVTMQNHTPYQKKVNPDIRVQNDSLSQTTKDTVESYANALKATDDAIHELIQYFSAVKEPTVIMVFGDHIPILGESTYEELGYLQYNQASDYRNGASTPFLIWNNYDLPKKDYPYIDSSYLGSILLDSIGFKQDAYFNYMFNQIDTLRAYHTEFFIDGKGKFYDHDQMTPANKKLLEDMWQLQYDRIFGSQDEKKGWLSNEED